MSTPSRIPTTTASAYPFANRFFMLTFTAIRQIPMIAWVPILIIWFGIGEESKVAVIFLAAYFPVLVNTVSGIERTDPKLIEVGKMYHLNCTDHCHPGYTQPQF